MVPAPRSVRQSRGRGRGSRRPGHRGHEFRVQWRQHPRQDHQVPGGGTARHLAIYTGDRHSLASTSKDYTQQVAADATSVHPQTGPESPFGTLTTLRAVAHPGRLRPPITNRRRGFPGPGWRPAPRCCPRLYRRGRHPGRPEDHRFVALGRQRRRHLPGKRQLCPVHVAVGQ